MSKNSNASSAFSPSTLKTALPLALSKMNPHQFIVTSVMFLVEVGAAFTLVLAIVHPSLFSISIMVWLWLTVLFATLAEAVAEGRGKTQAESLRASCTTSDVFKLNKVTNATAALENPVVQTAKVAVTGLASGGIVVVSAGKPIPAGGDVTVGAASIDESAITGESAPVIREAGGDCCAVTGGTRVLSDAITIEVTTMPGESFMDRMIGLVEGAQRKKTPNELALGSLLHVSTLIFLMVVIALAPMAIFNGAEQDPLVLVALLICLIPTTIGVLLSAIGIAGMDRLVQRNVLAMSDRAVEAAGDVATLLLDETGTITFGNCRAVEFSEVGDTTHAELVHACQLSSLADRTPEGRSIVELAETESNERIDESIYANTIFIPFTAQTRMSGIEFPATGGEKNRKMVKGTATEIVKLMKRIGTTVPPEADDIVQRISEAGGTALVVAEVFGGDEVTSGKSGRVLGVIYLKDVVKPGMRERFNQLREMGIRTVMITGDNTITARAIAKGAGVDNVLVEATPEQKLELVRKEQSKGHLVAMTGDGTNDVPALAQADVGVAMNTGISAAKKAANMVGLDSDSTKLIDVMGIDKQLLTTRGTLTIFSVANDVAKCFAIIPAMFVTALSGPDKLNVMNLHSPESATLSAVIFNALVIVALIPLALKGVKYRAGSAASPLSRNLLIFGVDGTITPLVGIKIIDLLLSGMFGM